MTNRTMSTRFAPITIDDITGTRDLAYGALAGDTAAKICSDVIVVQQAAARLADIAMDHNRDTYSVESADMCAAACRLRSALREVSTTFIGATLDTNPARLAARVARARRILDDVEL